MRPQHILCGLMPQASARPARAEQPGPLSPPIFERHIARWPQMHRPQKANRWNIRRKIAADQAQADMTDRQVRRRQRLGQQQAFQRDRYPRPILRARAKMDTHFIGSQRPHNFCNQLAIMVAEQTRHRYTHGRKAKQIGQTLAHGYNGHVAIKCNPQAVPLKWLHQRINCSQRERGPLHRFNGAQTCKQGF